MIKFQGVYTAIVTPFNKDGSIDWTAFDKLIDLQLNAGISGIVPCGTTGESPTLKEDEQLGVIRRTVERCRGRCSVIAGTGSNNTAHAVHLSRAAQELGVDGCLVVNPYYNKPTQEGLFRHFQEVAQAIQIPVMVYNIKGRTGVNLETDTLMRLIAACPNIVAVKEASGDLNQMRQVIERAPKEFVVLSGDDNLTLELMRFGGRGVVSVVSNIIPKEMMELVTAASSKDWDRASQIHNQFNELFSAIFIETNPIPVKAILAEEGLCKEIYRLPLCEMGAENRKELLRVWKESNK